MMLKSFFSEASIIVASSVTDIVCDFLCGKYVVGGRRKQTTRKEKFYFSSFVFIKDDDESGVVNISGGEHTKKMMTMMCR